MYQQLIIAARTPSNAELPPIDKQGAWGLVRSQSATFRRPLLAIRPGAHG